jgi:cytochrome c oxidase cbb3-type subunit 1
MWIAGVMQGLMWRSVNADGTLVYSFVESVKASFPFYVIRLLGGVLYFVGMLVMAWNVVQTMRQCADSVASDRAAALKVAQA